MRRPIAAERWRRPALLCLFATAIAATASAQGVAGSFEQLQVLVKPGDMVTIVDAAGVETKGTIAELSGSTLALLSVGTRRELSESDVRTIKQVRTDSLANGALYGAAGGAAFATTAMIIFADDGWDVSEGAAVLGVYAAMGAGIGVCVDALIRRQHLIYERQPTSKLHVSLAPWLAGRQKGVLVMVRF